MERARSDNPVSAEEAQRRTARCAQADESAQSPLARFWSTRVCAAPAMSACLTLMAWRWLAERAGMAYFRIDPLKVDVGKVAETMSAAYAERYCVLPVQVTPSEVVVATAEPFITDWVSEVEVASRAAGVRRVMANPVDIQRYTTEFFQLLLKSVRSAQKSGANTGASFEQLVELGQGSRQLDANDQGVVQVVDWLK